MLDRKLLLDLGAPSSVVDKRADKLFSAMAEHDISAPLRVAHFLAQVFHESANLSQTVENLNYSSNALRAVFGKYFKTDPEAVAYARQPEKIANRVYANRMGNGSEESGEGWKYRGRGFIQMTGKTNYRDFAEWVDDFSLLVVPDLVAHEYAAHSAVYFWTTRKLNALADVDDLRTITRKINGGYNGLEHRGALLRKLKGKLL